MKKRREINPVAGFFLLVFMAIIVVPYGVGYVVWIRLRERRLFRKLLSVGRIMAWEDVQRRLNAGEGTLVIEQAQKESMRLWWAPEDISALSPYPVPTFDELCDGGAFFFKRDRPAFVDWCFWKFLNPSTGTAFLTKLKRKNFPPGFLDPKFFGESLPNARIVVTVLQHAT